MRFIDIKNNRPLQLRSILRKKAGIAKICRRYGIELLFLHGSLAKDRHGPLSDIDIAVVWPKMAYKKLSEVERDLTKLIGREDVDLSVLDKASSLLGMQVITNGIPLYVKRDRSLTEFHYQTYRRYLDSQYLRRQYADHVTRAVL